MLDSSFRAAQRAWDAMEPPDGPDLPEDYPVCLFCGDPTGPDYRDWDGVKKPFQGSDEYCEECVETYACVKCDELHVSAQEDKDGVCEMCKSKGGSNG